MDMMFIHDKGFRNDVETFIDLFRKLFVAVRKSGSQLFIGKCMFDDACRKSGQIGFTFANRFFTMIRRNYNFCDLRLFAGILFQVFASLKESNRESWPSISETAASDLRPKNLWFMIRICSVSSSI